MMVVLSLIIILPPLMYGYVYPTGGDDTAHHLAAITAMSPTNLNLVGYSYSTILSYAGRWLVGYPLVISRDFLHVPITTSFLWFNYLALIGIVLTSYLVFSRLCNQIAGMLTALVSLLFSTNIQLFQAGAVFNIINTGIILPWIMYFGVKAWLRKQLNYGIACGLLMALFAIFHPTGRYLATLPAILLVVWWQHKRLKSNVAVVLVILGIMVASLLTVAYIFPFISPDPGRQWVDAFALIWLIVAVATGWFLQHFNSSTVVASLVAIGLIGGYFMFPSWFSYTSAVKPIDKEIMAYVNTLPESGFYGNEYVPPYLYELYLTKTYEPDGGIYIWRSQPMTAGVTQGSHFYYWDEQGKSNDTKPPSAMKSIRYFERDGIKAYVAEAILP